MYMKIKFNKENIKSSDHCQIHKFKLQLDSACNIFNDELFVYILQSSSSRVVNGRNVRILPLRSSQQRTVDRRNSMSQSRSSASRSSGRGRTSLLSSLLGVNLSPRQESAIRRVLISRLLGGDNRSSQSRQPDRRGHFSNIPEPPTQQPSNTFMQRPFQQQQQQPFRQQQQQPFRQQQQQPIRHQQQPFQQQQQQQQQQHQQPFQQQGISFNQPNNNNNQNFNPLPSSNSPSSPLVIEANGQIKVSEVRTANGQSHVVIDASQAGRNARPPAGLPPVIPPLLSGLKPGEDPPKGGGVLTESQRENQRELLELAALLGVGGQGAAANTDLGALRGLGLIKK